MLTQKAKFHLNNINEDNVISNKNDAVGNYKVSVYSDDKYFVKISVNSNSCSCEVTNRHAVAFDISTSLFPHFYFYNIAKMKG